MSRSKPLPLPARLGRRNRLRWIMLLLVALLALGAAPWLLGRKCPRRIAIATGGSDGVYYQVAHRYREILARDGIELEVLETAGSVENAGLLAQGDSRVSLALIQGGAAPQPHDSSLRSLASLYLEPVWVFYRGERPATSLHDIRQLLAASPGGGIAVGPAGSGSQAVARTLLDEIDGRAFWDRHAREIGGSRAAEALLRGEVQAAVFVISPESPIVKRLLSEPSIRLMSFARAEAFCRRRRYFKAVTIPQGAIDLGENLPQQDVQMLAPTATLVARADLHPALASLVLAAAEKVHSRGGLLERPGEFPSAQFVDFPLSDDASRYFQQGPSFLYRYLPFQWAAWLDRIKLLVLPLFTLMIPLAKLAPPVYRWRIRRNIYRWYKVLRQIDQRLKADDGRSDFLADVLRLKQLEKELTEVSVPLSYMEEFYNLRLHVAFVLERLERRTPPQVELPRLAA